MALGDVVLVPVTNPASAAALSRFAAWIAAPDGGRVVALSIVGLDADDARREEAGRVVAVAESAAHAAGAEATGEVVADRSVIAAVEAAVKRTGATFVVVGWRGSDSPFRLFGDVVDTIVGRSTVPLAVVRGQAQPTQRIVLPISDEHLMPGGAGGLDLAGQISRRVRDGLHRPLVVLQSGPTGAPLPREITEPADSHLHDPRAMSTAVAEIARPGDLIVAPIAPTATGLRRATTHLLSAAPEAAVAVAVDIGPRGTVHPSGSLSAMESSEYEVSVRVGAPAHAVDPISVGRALSSIGHVGEVDAWRDDRQRSWVQTTVQVTAPCSSTAVTTVVDTVENLARANPGLTFEVHAEPMERVN